MPPPLGNAWFDSWRNEVWNRKYLQIHENNQFSLKETRLREKHEYAVLGRSPNFLCQIAPSPPPQTKAMAVPSTARCLEWKGSVIWRNNRTQETHATHARNGRIKKLPVRRPPNNGWDSASLVALYSTRLLIKITLIAHRSSLSVSINAPSSW